MVVDDGSRSIRLTEICTGRLIPCIKGTQRLGENNVVEWEGGWRMGQSPFRDVTLDQGVAASQLGAFSILS